MNIKRLFVLVMALLLCMPITAYAATDTITKEYPFESKSKDFDYPAPAEIKEGGTKYQLKDIQYKIISKPEKVTKKVTYSGLTEKEVPQTIKRNGKKLALKKVDWTENKEESRRNAATGSLTFTGYDNRPDAPQTKEITATLPNGEKITVTGHLTGITKSGSSFSKPFTVRGKFTGDSDVSYYMLGNTRWPNNQSSPAFEGYEQIISDYLALGSNYKLTSAAWDGDYKVENGKTVRYATFSGMRLSQNWTATYTETLTANSPSYTSISTTYNAEATYSSVSNDTYKVTAICTYEPEAKRSLLPIIIGIGVGICVLAITIVIILQIIKRKKKGAENENSN